MTAKKDPKDFESAIKRLEEITDLLEEGETSLEESINLYTEGLKLAGFCNKQLEDSEKKVKVISEESGLFTETELKTGETDL